MTTDALPPSRSTGPAYGFSIRTHLLRRIAAAILPMLVLAGVLAWYYGSAARQTIAAERLDIANNLANMLDREIGSMGRRCTFVRALKRDIRASPVSTT